MMKVMPRRRCKSISSACVLSRNFLSSAASGSSSSSTCGRRASERASATRCLLAAGELVGLSLLHALELDQRHHLGDARIDLGARHASAFQAERDIVAHRQMRKQRVVLEHHVDGTLMRQDLRDVAASEQDTAFVRRLEAGEHAQQRGLAAAARAKQGKEFAGADIERELVDRAKVAEFLRHSLDAQQRHVGCGRLLRGVDFSARALFGLRQFLAMSFLSPSRRKLAADRHGSTASRDVPQYCCRAPLLASFPSRGE